MQYVKTNAIRLSMAIGAAAIVIAITSAASPPSSSLATGLRCVPGADAEPLPGVTGTDVGSHRIRLVCPDSAEVTGAIQSGVTQSSAEATAVSKFHAQGVRGSVLAKVVSDNALTSMQCLCWAVSLDPTGMGMLSAGPPNNANTIQRPQILYKVVFIDAMTNSFRFAVSAAR
jgi:hypothetical protein